MLSVVLSLLLSVSFALFYKPISKDDCKKQNIVSDLHDIVKKIKSGPDLSEELGGQNQSGGRIIVTQDQDGKVKVIRLPEPKLSFAEEMAQREEVFQLFKKINIVKSDELGPNEEIPNEKVMNLLHEFALSDVGAVWLRRVTDDTIANINRGYLEIDPKKKKLLDLVTGKSTEDAQFDSDFVLFKIYSFSGKGARGGGARVGIGDELFRDTFPSSGQKIDPLAIISHEFGHTRYGDINSGEHIHGEADCVEHFENPARIHNHYDERLTYCDPKTNTEINIKTRVVKSKNCNPKTETASSK